MSKPCYFRKGETDFERPTDNVQDQRVLLVPPAAQRPPSSQLWGRESQTYLYSGQAGAGAGVPPGPSARVTWAASAPPLPRGSDAPGQAAG